MRVPLRLLPGTAGTGDRPPECKAESEPDEEWAEQREGSIRIRVRICEPTRPHNLVRARAPLGSVPASKQMLRFSDSMPGEVQQDGTTLVDLIGKTPLVRLRSFERECPGVELYAKAEWQNPGGSVKDRPAARMMADGVSSGQLTRDKTLLDATSGNTGIAYGMIGAALGYRIKLCMPTNVTPERKKILRAYGAELVYTDPMDGSDGAIREARRLYAESPDEYFYPDQYNNDANWRAHYEGTGLEIIEQTDGRVTHFVAGLGTSGTFMGVSRRLREFGKAQRRSIKTVSLQPDGPLHGLEGLKHMETAIVPGIYDPTLADEDIRIGTEESYSMVRRLTADEGLLVGPSSGAAVVGGLQVARQLTEGVLVMIFCDGGEKYLTQRFWEADEV